MTLGIETTKTEDSISVVSVSGEQDAYTAPALRESLAAAATGERPRIVVDLREVTFLDSTTLGVLVGSAKRVEETEGGQMIACDRSNLLKVFDISGTRELLGVVPSVDEALQALRRRFAAESRETNKPGGEKGGAD